ncbi:MAG: FliH/SctL family protein [Defluviitaleaceae bacterium]|nr:FliH/SctL family protein [Defluviitaleaceae bacterium]
MFRKIIKSHAVTVDTENQQSIGNSSDEVLAAAVTSAESVVDISVVEESPVLPDVDLEQTRERAQDIINNANRNASEILAAARADADRMIEDETAKLALERERTIEEAREIGRTEGHAQGYADGQAKAQGIVDDAEALRLQTEQEREDALARFEGEIVKLISDVLDKIGDGKINANPDLILSLIRQGLGQSNFTGDVTLRVSAEDYDHVIANKADILTQIEGGANLEIIKDHSLGAADCLIETPFGVVDSSLGMQLEEVKRDLAQILAQ